MITEPAFHLTADILNAMPRDDMHAIFCDLQEAGLAHLPFPQVTITWDYDASVGCELGGSTAERRAIQASHEQDRRSGWHVTKQSFHRVRMDTLAFTSSITASDGRGHIRHETEADVERGLAALSQVPEDIHARLKAINESADTYLGNLAMTCRCLTEALIVALATRNVRKETFENTRTARGKPARPQFVGPSGIIYVSRTVLDVPRVEGGGTHASPIFHLRRGHQHTFLHGRGKMERKVKWLPPMFVAADEDYVPEAKRYVVNG